MKKKHDEKNDYSKHNNDEKRKENNVKNRKRRQKKLRNIINVELLKKVKKTIEKSKNKT